MLVSTERGNSKGRTAVRSIPKILFFFSALGIWMPVSAQERTAYMLRNLYPDTELVKVDLLSEVPFDPVEPIVVGPLGMEWVSSMAMTPSGEFLALDYFGDRLLEINRATGAASPYVDLDLDIDEKSDIAFDETGQAWLMNSGPGSDYLYRLNHLTGEFSVVTELENWVSKIAVHNGTVYAGRGSEFIEIDTATGEFTVLMDMQGNEWGCGLTALYSNGVDLWGIWGCWNVVATWTTMVTFFPSETVMDIVAPDLSVAPFALVVVTQPPPTAIPAISVPGLIVFAFLLAGAGSLVVRSRFSG